LVRSLSFTFYKGIVPLELEEWTVFRIRRSLIFCYPLYLRKSPI